MSMIFPINAKANTKHVRNNWTTTRRESRRGYDIEYLCEHKTNGAQFVLSVYVGKYPFYLLEFNAEGRRIFFHFDGYRNIEEQHGSTINLKDVDIYINGYKKRTERSMRYLQKYGSMACLVHGLIAAGLVESTEAPTEPETIEGKEDTTTAKTEPQEGAETAQREPETVTGYIVQCKASRNQWTDYTGAYKNRAAAEKAKACAESRHTCDRYGKEIMYRIAEVQKRPEEVMNDLGHYKTGETVTHNGIIYTQYSNAPALNPYLWESRTESGEVIVRLARSLDECREETAQRAAESHEENKPQENTTTPETDAQRAAESAGKTADDTTTTAGYTEPQRATERAAAATGGSVSQSDRRTRPAAPQSHGSGEGIQRHHRPPKKAYRATQSAMHIPAEDHRRRVAASRGSPKICIS